MCVGLCCHDRGRRRDGACAAARLVGKIFGVSNEPIWVRPVAAALMRLPHLNSADFGVSNSAEHASTREELGSRNPAITWREEPLLLSLFSNRSLGFGAAPLADVAHIDEAIGEF